MYKGDVVRFKSSGQFLCGSDFAHVHTNSSFHTKVVIYHHQLTTGIIIIFSKIRYNSSVYSIKFPKWNSRVIRAGNWRAAGQDWSPCACLTGLTLLLLSDTCFGSKKTTNLLFGSEGMLSTVHLLVVLELGFSISCAHKMIIHWTARFTTAHSGSNLTAVFTFLHRKINRLFGMRMRQEREPQSS